MMSPKLICAGVGLKLYLSAGIRSAAPGMFLAYLVWAVFKAAASGPAG